MISKLFECFYPLCNRKKTPIICSINKQCIIFKRKNARTTRLWNTFLRNFYHIRNITRKYMSHASQSQNIFRQKITNYRKGKRKFFFTKYCFCFCSLTRKLRGNKANICLFCLTKKKKIFSRKINQRIM